MQGRGKVLGFTLLELIIVIVILGVLAVLGFSQYSKIIEKSRGAEAKMILGDLRKIATAYRLEKGTITGITATDLGMGTTDGTVPTACRASHDFSYAYTTADPSITFTATRCSASGKTSCTSCNSSSTLVLTSNLNTGTDAWSGGGGY